MTYRVDDLEQLQDHMLPTLHRARLQDLQDGQQAVRANDEILDVVVFPEQSELFTSVRTPLDGCI